MAITKVTTVEYIQVYPAYGLAPDGSTAPSTTNAAHPTIVVREKLTLDDTEDAELPITQLREKSYEKFNADASTFDYSSLDDLVKKVAAAVW